MLATLNNPYGIAASNNGTIYIADYGNNRIRKMLTPNGIETIQTANKVLIYPNPANSSITVTNLTGIHLISVSDCLGREVYHTEINQNRLLNQTTEIQLPLLKTGCMYLEQKV